MTVAYKHLKIREARSADQKCTERTLSILSTVCGREATRNCSERESE